MDRRMTPKDQDEMRDFQVGAYTIVNFISSDLSKIIFTDSNVIFDLFEMDVETDTNLVPSNHCYFIL